MCLKTGWIYISAIRRKKVHSLEACWKWILLTEAFEAKCDTSSRKLYSVLFLAQAYFYRIKDQMSDSLQPFFYILWDLVSSGMFSHKNDRMGHSVTGTNHYFFYIEYILFCRCTYMLPKADYKSVRPLVIPLLNSVVSEWMYSESLYLHNKQKWLFFS